MELMLATNNEKKRAELAEVLAPLGLTLLLPRDRSLVVEPEETGKTFLENAEIKARSCLAATRLPSLADDSGLEVMALGGAPGIFSARYGAPEARTDADRNALLLQALEGNTDRRARFVCALFCVFPDGRTITAEGFCEGEIALSPAGAGGFGYDPLFYLPQFCCTMADIPKNEKNKISHRANAFKIFSQKWE